MFLMLCLHDHTLKLQVQTTDWLTHGNIILINIKKLRKQLDDIQTFDLKIRSSELQTIVSFKVIIWIYSDYNRK